MVRNVRVLPGLRRITRNALSRPVPVRGKRTSRIAESFRRWTPHLVRRGEDDRGRPAHELTRPLLGVSGIFWLILEMPSPGLCALGRHFPSSLRGREGVLA